MMSASVLVLLIDQLLCVVERSSMCVLAAVHFKLVCYTKRLLTFYSLCLSVCEGLVWMGTVRHCIDQCKNSL